MPFPDFFEWKHYLILPKTAVCHKFERLSFPDPWTQFHRDRKPPATCGHHHHGPHHHGLHHHGLHRQNLRHRHRRRSTAAPTTGPLTATSLPGNSGGSQDRGPNSSWRSCRSPHPGTPIRPGAAGDPVALRMRWVWPKRPYPACRRLRWTLCADLVPRPDGRRRHAGQLARGPAAKIIPAACRTCASTPSGGAGCDTSVASRPGSISRSDNVKRDRH